VREDSALARSTKTMNFKPQILILVMSLLSGLPRTEAQSQRATNPTVKTDAAVRATQMIVEQGVAVEFSFEPVGSTAKQGAATAQLSEGAEVSVRFQISDNHTGQALTGLRPIAWIDQRKTDAPTDARQCRTKIQSFLQANFSARPDVDLNSFFILALNHEPNISVIDPLLGFGGSKLYTLIPLESPGEDWVLSSDRRRLFVTLPQTGHVAVVDTGAWKVLKNVDAGTKPTRIALQRDEKYLWVGNDAEGDAGGVTVIDTAQLKTVAHFKTGDGHHDIAFAADDRYAFVTNKLSGTLSVVDVRRLAVVKEIKTGALPSALAISPLSRVVYVVHEGDGAIVGVDEHYHRVLTRLAASPGLAAIRFLPGERFGFVANRLANVVHIFDSSTNRMLHTVAVGAAPDQISFTRNYAYVRTRGNEFVSMISLNALSREGQEVSVNRFPAGQKAPADSPYTSVADAVVAAPEEGAVLVANPADKMIYYYTEGMAAPMGNFQNYRRDPRALLVWNRGLRETAPGVYTTNVRLARRGHYDVAFLLDSPRMSNCFSVQVGADGERGMQTGATIKVSAVSTERSARAGENFRLRFNVTDARTGQPKPDLPDMGVMTFLAPGIWQQRVWAKPLGGGLYEATFVPPQAGAYYIFFQCPSLGVRYNDLPNLTLQVTTRETDAAPPASPTNNPARP
jgi:YVTN family beta-propeller protein